MITIYYRACDGYRATRRFKTLAGARKYAIERVGKTPEFSMGGAYAVSSDGIGTIRVEGCYFRDLWPEAFPHFDFNIE